MTPRSLVRRLLLPLAAGLLLPACATIMQGTSQEVSIASTPTGARLIIDGADAGRPSPPTPRRPPTPALTS